MNRSKTDNVSIDWTEVENICGSATPKELPKNAITIELIMKKYGDSHTTSRRRMRELEASGLYDSGLVKCGFGKQKYLVRKK